MTMTRWIAFDEDTAAELRSQLPNQVVFEAPGRTALEYALTASRTVVAVLGPPAGDETAIAVFRPRRHNALAEPQVSTPVVVSTTVRASGFLGLSDHLVEPEEEEEAAKKKRWWRWWE
jgi:hypothetical protein